MSSSDSTEDQVLAHLEAPETGLLRPYIIAQIGEYRQPRDTRIEIGGIGVGLLFIPRLQGVLEDSMMSRRADTVNLTLRDAVIVGSGRWPLRRV